MTLYERILSEMAIKGIKYASELERRAGLTNGAMRNIRNGHLPTPDRLARIADVLDFHQLRHMNASIMAMLNVPEKYAQERGGWKTPHTMKRVYQHTFSQERQNVDRQIDEFFEKKIGKVD